MSPIAEAVSFASQSFTGQLLQPGDAWYDDRRRVHNGLIERSSRLASRAARRNPLQAA